MIKSNPELFGLTEEMADALPDITDEDISGLISFLAQKMAAFAGVNHRFDVVETPYSHVMIMDENSRDHVRQYILSYLKNGKL